MPDTQHKVIALVGPIPPPFGGMANQLAQLHKLLNADGVAAELVPVNPAYRPAWIGRVRGVRAVTRLFPYITNLWRAVGRARVVHVFANSGWSWHLFAAPAIWVAQWRRVPCIVNYRGGEARSFLERSFRGVAPSLRRASLVVVPSGFLQAVFQDFGVDSRIIPNIVNLELFSPRPRGAWRLAAPHLIVTRNLEAIYDVATSIRAFSRIAQSLPDARLSIAGEGPELAALRSLATRLGMADRIRFLGRLDNAAMAALYSDADLMLNSSTVDNMPISILESLASGVPVVSTDAGGIPWLVEHGQQALLVPVGDHAGLASAGLSLLRDAERYEAFVERGLEHITQFAWPRVEALWLAAYRHVRAS